MTSEIEPADDLKAEIVRDLAMGITLSEICRRDHMPVRQTVYDWMAADDEFARRIARARELGFDVLAEDCLNIAEDGSNDWIERQNPNGTKYVALDGEHVQRSKLRIETRLKLLAKWSPKKYGDRQQVAATDIDGEPAQFAPIMFVPVEAKKVED